MSGAATAPAHDAGRVVGRYRVYDEIASGGMATVHLGRLIGPVGFSRTVAVKQLHAQFAKDPEFVSMFLDEARLAARIHHPNVVPTLDVVATKGELFLIMDYVHGESLSRLIRASPGTIPPKILAAIIAGALHGLHSAHEARTERGIPLGIVHRDISPQNIIVGVDGVPRVLDFGVAKASDRLQTTEEGKLKGKIRYMAPEQVTGLGVSRSTDIYATAIVLHEAITGRSLFGKMDAGALVNEILTGTIQAPSTVDPALPRDFDAIVLRGLARKPEDRYASARDMALAIEEAVGLASASQIGAWVSTLVGESLTARAAMVSLIEHDSSEFPKPLQLPEIGSVPPGPMHAPSGEVETSAAPTGSGVISQVSLVAPHSHPPEKSRTIGGPTIFAIGAVVVIAAAIGAMQFFPKSNPAPVTSDPSVAQTSTSPVAQGAAATVVAAVSATSSAAPVASAIASASASAASAPTTPPIKRSKNSHAKPQASTATHPVVSAESPDDFRTRE